MLRELNSLSIGLRMLLVVITIVAIFVVGALFQTSAMCNISHAKITTLWLNIATVRIKDSPLWSLGKCKTVFVHPILNVLSVAKKVILPVIAKRNNVVVGSSVVVVVNPVVIHVVRALTGANFRHNVVAKIIIIGSLIM